MKRLHSVLIVAALGLCSSRLCAQARNYGETFTTTGVLATNTAAFNYTLNTSYSGSGDPGTTANMFIVRGESSSSDHSIVTVNSVTGYYVNTVNTQNTNFGFYLMNLNFTDITSGQNDVVNFSFKILGNDTNSSINPNNWNVKYTTGTTSVGVASYTTTATTFSFVDDNSTWTTVSGSFIIPSGTGSTRGGILINAGTSGSVYTSSGGYYLADLAVTVSAASSIPEPATAALLSGLAVLGVVGLRRRRRGPQTSPAV